MNLPTVSLQLEISLYSFSFSLYLQICTIFIFYACVIGILWNVTFMCLAADRC